MFVYSHLSFGVCVFVELGSAALCPSIQVGIVGLAAHWCLPVWEWQLAL